MYGLNETDLKFMQVKHSVQRKFLKNSFFQTQNGELKSLLDVSFHANHSSRYYAELINKINTINEIIMSDTIEYQNIFLTITLDGFFRDFLVGNFERYCPVKHFSLIPNNDRFGYLRDKIYNKEMFTIKDLYNVLNFQYNRFQKSNKYMKIKKDGYKIHYVKVCEPHKKDGVPHFHIMLYIPKIFFNDIFDMYKKYFTAPQNLKKIDTKGQLQGFQWDIKSAPAYILKYMYKSFLDVKNQKKLDYLQSWYLKNRILRIVTSHSLIPAWVYRRIMPLERDWHYLTDIRKTGICEWSQLNNYFKFEDEKGRILEYENGVFRLFFKDRILKEFGKEKEKFVIRKPTKLRYKKKYIEPNVYIEDKIYSFTSGRLIEVIKVIPVNKLSHLVLFQKYNEMNNLNFDDFDINKYLVYQNELIKRKIIKGNIQRISNFNIRFRDEN